MISTAGNFSTGPINISKEVQLALASSPVSHRSQAFHKLYNGTKEFLCEQFNTQQAFFITGSGTAANEAMIWQIKIRGGKGLILSNGEFGSRLIEQAERASLQFTGYNVNFGECLDTGKIETAIHQNKINWVLFCHCETSTGVVNDLTAIAEICVRNNCLCFVDCMSTAGTCSLDLSNISMATASSGKGLASVAGLAIVFSNVEVVTATHTPLYLDLRHYSNKEGIPFTLSSNLLTALNVSARQKLHHEQYTLIDHYSNECFRMLRETGMLPFNNEHSKVFTIFANNSVVDFVEKIKRKNIVVSHESEYLRKRDLCQLAFFGYYQKSDVEKLVMALKETTRVLAR
jgi:aspartate aminotransferase-like enzyme